MQKKQNWCSITIYIFNNLREGRLVPPFERWEIKSYGQERK